MPLRRSNKPRVSGEQRELFKVTIYDCDAFPARPGKGGKGQNKAGTAMTVVHGPSGATASSREDRSQRQNARIAFERMLGTEEFSAWRESLTAEKNEQRIEE